MYDMERFVKAEAPASVSRDAVEADRLCQEGYALLEERRFDEALARFTRARALAPDNPLVHYRMGLLYSDTGRLDDALHCFEASLRLNPDDVRAQNNRGAALESLGRAAEAEIAFRHALELAPDAEIPYVNLGHLLEQAGRKQEAADLYREAMARDLNPPLFAHCLATIAGHATDRAPDPWVIATFDSFAPTFDAHLHRLGYQVPRLLATALFARGEGPWDILDLGCGTGQCGEAVAPRKRRLVGVDLSPPMLAQAKARGIYDELATAEVHAWLRAAPAECFDVVCAADVLIYIGALEGLFRDVARVLRTGGWFAFSTEECTDLDFRLQPSGRYAQSLPYIRRLGAAAFTVVVSDPIVIRMESGSPVPGRLHLLHKR